MALRQYLLYYKIFSTFLLKISSGPFLQMQFFFAPDFCSKCNSTFEWYKNACIILYYKIFSTFLLQISSGPFLQMQFFFSPQIFVLNVIVHLDWYKNACICPRIQTNNNLAMKSNLKRGHCSKSSKSQKSTFYTALSWFQNALIYF